MPDQSTKSKSSLQHDAKTDDNANLNSDESSFSSSKSKEYHQLALYNPNNTFIQPISSIENQNKGTQQISVGNEFEPILCNHNESIEQAGARIFRVDDKYTTPKLLYEIAFKFGSFWGFRVIKRSGIYVRCSRCEKPRQRKGKINQNMRVSSSLKCNCDWHIRYKKLPKENGKIIITHVSLSHTNRCMPSSNQLVRQKTIAGDFTKNVHPVLQILANQLSVGEKPHYGYIRTLLKQVLPARKEVTRRDIWNTRIRAKMFLKQALKAGKPISEFRLTQEQLPELMKPIENETEDIMDSAVDAVDELFLESMNDDECNMKLLGIIEQLGKQNSGFTYALCHNEDHVIMGFVWMTAVMRSNFERFSQFICIDSRKSKTNPNLFPYMSVVVLDEMNKVQVCCEALIKEEMHDAYIFMLNSAFEMCPLLEREHVKCVYGDEFITQNILDSTQLKHAMLFHDHYHLNLNFEKKLDHNFSKLQPYLYGILHAKSEEVLKTTLNQMVKDFPSLTSVKTLAIELESKKQNFAAYVIDSTEGSYCRRGNPPSEANHSSISRFLGSDFTGEIENVFVKLMDRHKHLTLRTNRIISIDFDKSQIALHKLKEQDPNSDLIAPCEFLTYSAFLFYRDHIKPKSNQYLVKSNEDGSIHIYYPNKSDSPYIFRNKSCRCSCSLSRCKEMQCHHELALHGHFCKELFSKKYEKRSSVTKSKNIGEYINPLCFSSRLQLPDASIIDDSDKTNEEHSFNELEQSDSKEAHIEFNEDNNHTSNPIQTENSQSDTDVSDAEDVCAEDVSNISLSYKEMMNIVGMIHNRCRNNPSLIRMVSAFLIDLSKIIENNHTSHLHEANKNELNSVIISILRSYKRSFTTLKKKNNSSIVLKAPERINGHQYHTTKRLRPKVECKKSHRAKKNKSNSLINSQNSLFQNSERRITCQFCTGSHKITNCLKKKELGKTWLGKDIIKYMKEYAPYSILQHKDTRRVITDEISNTKTARNLLIHTLHSKFLPSQACNPTEEELACTISLLNSKAEVVVGYERCIVSFQSVVNYIGKHQSTKNRFIFSSIEEESIGSSFYGRNQSLSQRHGYNNYVALANMSQNSVTSTDSQERSLVIVHPSRDIFPTNSCETEIKSNNRGIDTTIVPKLPPMDLKNIDI